MTRGLPHIVGAAITRIASFNEALAGDFTEEWYAGRSRAWLCLEIIVALNMHVLSSARPWKRLTIESGAVDVAAIGVFSLWVVFTANVIARALDGVHLIPVALTHYQGWGVASGVMSFVMALAIGAHVHRLRERHRRLVIVTVGLSVMLSALLNVYLVPRADVGAFFPSPILQTVVTAIFILGLSAGSSLTSSSPTRARHP